MNRAVLALAAAALLLAAPARAHPPRPNLIILNVGDLFGGVINVEYERALTSWFGLTAGISVWTFRGIFAPPAEPTFTGISPEFGARFHFIRDAPGGLWLGPYVSAGYLFSRSDGGLARAWAWGVGAALGYNFIFGRHFTFQLGVGGGFTDYGDRLVWAPRLRLGLGAAF
ncbi:MAG: hypothetical protein Q8L48_27445 [Archangium sp.]|nr:hypothetical protein [Archangium sp.]